MQTTILCNLSDAEATIEEAKLEWIYDVLGGLNIPQDIIEAKDKDVDHFRNSMSQYGIEVELFTNGCVDVYKKTWIEELSGWAPANKNNLVAQWKEPKYTRKMEGGEVYYEIYLNEWTAVRKTND